MCGKWVDVFGRQRESNKEREEKGREREIVLICDSLVECVRACSTGRYEELGGTAESQMRQSKMPPRGKHLSATATAGAPRPRQCAGGAGEPRGV